MDRQAVILSIDEATDTVGRAGDGLGGVIGPDRRDEVEALLTDTGWDGVRAGTVPLHDGSTAVLIAAAVQRLVDVALVPVPEDVPEGIARAATALRPLLEDGDDAVWLLDRQGATVAVNPQLRAVLGRGPDEDIGAIWDHLGADDAAQVRAVLETGSWRRTVRLSTPGTPHQADLAGTQVTDLGGAAIGTLVRVSAEAPGIGYHARLARLTLHDPLTGLPNRRHLLDRLAATAEDTTAGVIAVLRCAVDGFTIINASHGETTGDRVLVEISDRLRALTRPEDFLARLGGDEFVLVAPGLDSPEDAHPMAERILAAFAEPFRTDCTALEVFASIGLVTYRPDDVPPAPVLLQRAETAMRRAKTDSLGGGWADYTGD